MKRKNLVVASTFCLVILATAAYALFTNGGFEDGTFNGWTVEHGQNFGLTTAPDNNNVEVPVAETVQWLPGPDPTLDNTWYFNEFGNLERTAITNLTDNGLVAFNLSPVKYQKHSIRVNSPDGNNHAHRISQESVLTAADRDSDLKFHVRFAWAAVLEDPRHDPYGQPYFHLILKNVTADNSVLYSKFFYTNQPGFPWRTDNTLNLGSGWKWIDWQEVDLDITDNVAVGDTIRIELSVGDCAFGGHGGYAYLDGFRSQAAPVDSGTGVTLFTKDTPNAFGCAVAPGTASWRESAGTLFLLALPALVLFGRKRILKRDRRRRGLFRGFLLFPLAAALILATSGRSDAGPLGPPQPSVAEGKFGGALGYYYTQEKWKPETDTMQASGITVTWETDKVTQNSLFLRGAYGIFKNFEASLKAGIANRGAPQGFKDSYTFQAGIGAKGILYGTPSFAVGPIIDFNWFTPYKDNISFTQGGVTWSGTEKIENSWDLMVGIGLQTPVGKGVIYAGPIFYWNQADVTYEISNGSVNLNVKNQYKQDSSFGGFAGIRYPIADRVALELEGQYISGFSFGATISYAF